MSTPNAGDAPKADSGSCLAGRGEVGYKLVPRTGYVRP
jgi:hypothetical protein